MANKFRIFQVHPNDRTYEGSIWDTPRIPSVPKGSKQLAEFTLDEGWNWMSVSEEEYQAQQKREEKAAREKGKIVIKPEDLLAQLKEYTFLVKGDKEELCIDMEDVQKVLTEIINK